MLENHLQGTYSVAILYALSSIGLFFCLRLTLILLWKFYHGFRIYVFSQYFARANLIDRYGKWALVTGATDGIGLSMARELARRGHSLVLVGRSREKLAKARRVVELELASNAQVMTAECDFSDPSDENYAQLMDQLSAVRQDISILINNAGLFVDRCARMLSFDMKLHRDMVNVNSLSMVHLSKLLMPNMISRGKGLIVNVTSSIATVPMVYVATYGASKAYNRYYTRQLQDEYKDVPVDIIELIPGGVFTRQVHETTKFTEPSLMNPSPDLYAKSALNSLATRCSSISGYTMHGLITLIRDLSQFFGCLKLLTRSALMMTAKQLDLRYW